MTGMAAAGWECPDCGSLGNHSVLGYHRNDDDEVIGIRLHCLRCEKVWNDVDDDIGQ